MPTEKFNGPPIVADLPARRAVYFLPPPELSFFKEIGADWLDEQGPLSRLDCTPGVTPEGEAYAATLYWYGVLDPANPLKSRDGDPQR